VKRIIVNTFIILCLIGLGYSLAMFKYAHLYWDSNNENSMYQEYLKNRFGDKQANKIKEYVKYHSTDKFLKSGIKERVR